MKRAYFLLLALLSCPVFAQINLDFKQVQKLQMASLAIYSLYVDSVDYPPIVENAINGMLEKLDPHSSYTNAEETKKLNEPLEGNFEGIGVQFNMLEDTLIVIQPVTKGPSERAGILAGDRIITVDGDTIAGVQMPRDSIMKTLRGPKGSKVRLGIKRSDVKELLFFNVTRDKIPVNTLDAAYMITPTIGYILLDRFGATTGDEVRKAIADLKRRGMEKLIIDLQINGGGYLGAAIDVANELLQRGDLIVYTEGRNNPRSTFNAKGGGSFTEGDVAILVNEYSASAAEILAGAVQDHDRGLIIGRRTFGKGLVQRPVELPDGSMIRLTVSHYYTPSGRCIQKPYVKGEKKDYDLDMENRFTHGELSCIDSIRLDSTKVFHTLRKQRTVYGGGGIMPDIFVPLDTASYSPLYRQINRANIFNEVVLKYVDVRRKRLKRKYDNLAEYIAKYEVEESLVDSVLSIAKRKKIEPKDSADLQATLPDLRFMLKALVAYNVWDRSEYVQLINERNDIVLKAVEILSEEKNLRQNLSAKE